MFRPIPIHKSIHPSMYVCVREEERDRERALVKVCHCTGVVVATRKRLTRLHQAAGAPG